MGFQGHLSSNPFISQFTMADCRRHVVTVGFRLWSVLVLAPWGEAKFPIADWRLYEGLLSCPFRHLRLAVRGVPEARWKGGFGFLHRSTADGESTLTMLTCCRRWILSSCLNSLSVLGCQCLGGCTLWIREGFPSEGIRSVFSANGVFPQVMMKAFELGRKGIDASANLIYGFQEIDSIKKHSWNLCNSVQYLQSP